MRQCVARASLLAAVNENAELSRRRARIPGKPALMSDEDFAKANPGAFGTSRDELQKLGDMVRRAM